MIEQLKSNLCYNLFVKFHFEEVNFKRLISTAAKVFMPVFLIILILLGVSWIFFGPTGTSGQTETFAIPKDSTGSNLPEMLREKGFIRSSGAFRFLMDNYAKGMKPKPGGYNLSRKMNAWQVLKKIIGKPDLLWVTIAGCLRKEQIGEKLAEVLGWSAEELKEWGTIYTTSSDYFEGVYYPDTYLIPFNETGAEVAKRFIGHFNEKFAPLADKFISANIKWTTGLKIASLIAREAAGTQDMRLISGIIWNRLNISMPLQIDATMQYTLGKRADGNWWGSVDLSEKQKDSRYNSYLYKGLPPTPICSPNIAVIEAALNPEETACLFYLHDQSGQIHCAKTYEEHQSNIRKYLVF